MRPVEKWSVNYIIWIYMYSYVFGIHYTVLVLIYQHITYQYNVIDPPTNQHNILEILSDL